MVSRTTFPAHFISQSLADHISVRYHSRTSLHWKVDYSGHRASTAMLHISNESAHSMASDETMYNNTSRVFGGWNFGYSQFSPILIPEIQSFSVIMWYTSSILGPTSLSIWQICDKLYIFRNLRLQGRWCCFQFLSSFNTHASYIV